MQETTFSDQYKWFLGFLSILTLVSLIVMNDYTTLQNSEEVFNVFHVQKQIIGTSTDSIAFFPNTSQFIIYRLFDFSPFWIRMSNVIVFLLLLLGIRIWGGKVFGKLQIITFIIILVSSFLMISMAKFAVADIPLCAFHMMTFLFLIICLKQPKLKWQIVYGLFVMGSFFVQPTGGVVYGVGLLLYMLLFHKNSVNLRKPMILGIWIGFITLFYFLGGFDWTMEGIVFSYRSSWNEYFTWQLIGLLPWFGFLPAALWDLFQKLRKKEEMAIILFGWLLFSLISHALILQLCLLFLIAKQVESYFKPNYPYKNLVKTFAVLNLVFTFFALFAVMMGGFAALRNIGFRSAMVFSAVYWVCGFVGIIGLFSDSRKFIIGGLGIGGAFSLMLFWVQLNPIVDRFRDLNAQLLTGIEKESSVLISAPMADQKQLQVYALGNKLLLGNYSTNPPKSDWILLNESDYQLFLNEKTGLLPVDTVKGRTSILDEQQLFYRIKTK